MSILISNQIDLVHTYAGENLDNGGLKASEQSPLDRLESLNSGLRSQSHDVQSIALEELRILANSISNRCLIISLNLITALVDIVKTDDSILRLKACEVLMNLGSEESNALMIGSPETGVLVALRDLVQKEKGEARVNASGAIMSLSFCSNNADFMCSEELGLLNVLISILKETLENSVGQQVTFKVWEMNTTIRTSICITFQNLSSLSAYSSMMGSKSFGLLVPLVEVIQIDRGQSQIAACGAIQNMALSDDNISYMGSAELGLLSAFVHVLSTDKQEAAFMVCDAITNLANIDSNSLRMCSIELGLLQVLAKVAEEDKSGARVKACVTLQQLSRHVDNKVTMCQPELPVVQVLALVAREGVPEDARLYSTGALFLLALDENNREYLCTPELGVISALVEVMKKDNGDARMRACSAISLLLGNDRNVGFMCSSEFNLIRNLVGVIKDVDVDDQTLLMACRSIFFISCGVLYISALCSPRLGLLASLLDIIRLRESKSRSNHEQLALLAVQTICSLSLNSTEKSGWRAIDAGVHKKLLSVLCESVKQGEEWSDFISEALSCILNLSMHLACAVAIKREGGLSLALDILATSSDDVESMKAVFLVALLTGREESNETWTKSLLLRPTLINDMLEVYQDAVGGLSKDSRYPIGAFTLRLIVQSFHALSISDGKKLRLAESSLPSLLVRSLKMIMANEPSEDDSRGTKERDMWILCRIVDILLQISFAITADNQIQAILSAPELGLILLLDSVIVMKKLSKEAKCNVGLLIYRLKTSIADLDKSALISPPVDADGITVQSINTHIMLSFSLHSDCQPKLVKAIDQALQELGYDVWTYEEGSTIIRPVIPSNAYKRMEEAISVSSVIVICVSREYKAQAHCRIEAEYAKSLIGKVTIVFLMMQRDYLPQSTSPDNINECARINQTEDECEKELKGIDYCDGWLGEVVNGAIWIPLWNEDCVQPAAKALEAILGDRSKIKTQTVFNSAMKDCHIPGPICCQF